MQTISAAVGSRARNRVNDVKLIQRFLNNWQPDIAMDQPLVVDGLAGRKTLLAIVEFQGRVMGMIKPDGRIDPGGRTLVALQQGKLNLMLLPRDGNGFYSYGKERKRHGTTKTITSVKRAAKKIETLGLTAGVGNISLPNGGPMPPHTSHQRGVDVDFRPLRKDGRRLGTNIHAGEYSKANTEKLVRALRQDKNLDLILFNDPHIPGVIFWTGHDNHLHVRFKK